MMDGDLSYEAIWAWCEAGALFGRTQRLTPLLCALLLRDDHHAHEDLAHTLQNLRSPLSVDCLYDRATRRLAHMDADDSSALARKCVWALHDVGTPEAIAKLRLLADDPREVVCGAARKRLEALAQQNECAGPQSYRVARDAALGGL